ncbi:MAG: DUF1573 domain-containing protein [Bacteroidota bacterium]
MFSLIKKSGFFLLLSCFSLYMVQAQESPKTEKEVKKELKQVLKELPLEAQQDILRYAERKQAALSALEKRGPKPTPQVAATPQTKPAAKPMPQSHPKPAHLNDGGTSYATPPAPKLPEYMETAQALPQTTVQWFEEMVDFGNIKEGDVAKHVFKFKNTGAHPLKLTRVRPSCGCTAPTFSKEEIAPGEEGFIEIAFNSTGKTGHQNKSITVTGNFENTHKLLRFKGVVEKKSQR